MTLNDGNLVGFFVHCSESEKIEQQKFELNRQTCALRAKKKLNLHKITGRIWQFIKMDITEASNFPFTTTFHFSIIRFVRFTSLEKLKHR